MARELTVDMTAAVLAQTIYPIMFALFDFASGPVRFWTGYQPITMGGDTYVGSGDIAQVSQIEEAAEVAAKGASFTLSGIPVDILTLALEDTYQGRACKLWLGAMTADGVLIADPYLLFAGRMDVIEVQDGGDTADITLTAESRLIDLNRSRERRWTVADQQVDYPTDTGFDFVNALQNKQLLWGNATNPTAGAGTNDGNGGDVNTEIN